MKRDKRELFCEDGTIHSDKKELADALEREKASKIHPIGKEIISVDRR